MARRSLRTACSARTHRAGARRPAPRECRRSARCTRSDATARAAARAVTPIRRKAAAKSQRPATRWARWRSVPVPRRPPDIRRTRSPTPHQHTRARAAREPRSGPSLNAARRLETVRVWIARAEAERRARDAHRVARGAKLQRFTRAPRRAGYASAHSGHRAPRASCALVAREAERAAVLNALFSEVPVRRALQETRTVTFCLTDVLAVRVARRFAQRDVDTIARLLLLASNTRRTRRALDGAVAARDDGRCAIAARFGCTRRAERRRKASARDETTDVVLATRRFHRAAVGYRALGGIILRARDEVFVIACGLLARVCATKCGRGSVAHALAKTRIDRGARRRRVEAMRERCAVRFHVREPPIDACAGIALAGRVVRVGAARDLRAAPRDRLDVRESLARRRRCRRGGGRRALLARDEEHERRHDEPRGASHLTAVRQDDQDAIWRFSVSSELSRSCDPERVASSRASRRYALAS